MGLRLQDHIEKLRFAIVGGINTALDFGIFFGLGLAGMSEVPANFISTTVGFSFSFFANRSYTFKNNDGDLKKQLIPFITITLFGLWILQPLIILATKAVMSDSSLPEGAVLMIGKVLATCVTLVWNYVLYSRVVFVKSAK